MSKRKISIRLLYFLAAVVTIFYSTTSVAASKSTLAKEQVLDVGLVTTDMGTFDPHGPETLQDSIIKLNIYNLLCRFPYGQVKGELQPSLATSWEVSDDGKTWTFRLRKGVNWHHGFGNFTANDVKFSFDRVRFSDVSVHKTATVWNILDEVIIVDSYTVKLHLKKPDFSYPIKLAKPSGGTYIVSQKAVEKYRDDYKTNPVGTGIMMFEAYNPQKDVVLVRNKDFFEGRPILEKMVAHYVPNLSSRNMALLEGTLDLISGPSEQSWVDDMNKRGMKVEVLGPGFSGIMAYNLTKPPLDNIKVRQAIAYAINREELSSFFGHTIAPIQISPVPKTWLFGIDSGISKYKYDPEKAKKLLKKAGYPNGFELHNFVSEKSYYRNHMEVIQQHLKKVGIDLKLTIVDHTTFHANQRKDLNSLPIVGYGPENDGGKILNLFFHSKSVVGKSTANFNFSHYGDVVGSVDNLLEEAEGQPAEKQAELYAKAQKKIMEELAVYPTVNVSQAFARQPYVKLGYEPEACFGSYLLTPETSILDH